jgi:hypothetical protein
MLQVTIKELAERWGYPYPAAAGIVQVLLLTKVAKIVGKRSVGKGKPSVVYEVPEEVEIVLSNKAK